MQLKKEFQIFVTFLALFALFTKDHLSLSTWNEASRMATVESLVDYHSFIIDNSRFATHTADKYMYEGHFYSDKPPILAIYGSLFYALLKVFGISFNNNYALTYYLLVLLVIGVSTCIGLVYFYKTLKIFKVSDKWSNVVLLVTGTGTLLLPYSTVFNNHTVSGVLLILSFYSLLQLEKNIKYSVLSGLLLTLAGSIDITTFVFVPFCFIVFFNKPFKSIVAFLLPCVLVMAIYFLLNVYTSGGVIPPAMNKTLWNYPGSAFGEESLSGLVDHKSFLDLSKYAFHMLLGKRGLLSYTPIILFSLLGFIKVFLKQDFKYKKEYLFIFIACLAYISMYIFRSNNLSGDAYGIRWYANLMFFLCLPLAHLGNEIKKSMKLTKFFIVVASTSIFISLVGLVEPFTHNSNFSFLRCLMLLTNSSLFFKIKLVTTAVIIYYLFFKFFKEFQKSSALSQD